METLGDFFLQFARSVDYLDEDGFDELREGVEDYVQQVLNVTAIRFLFANMNKEGRWSLAPLKSVRRLQLDTIPIWEGNELSGHSAYAFNRNVKLWIVSKDKLSFLSEADEYLNLWDERTNDLPRYRSIGERRIRTSIIIPVQNSRGDLYGTVNFETKEYLDKTRAAERELTNISEALGTSFLTYQNSVAQHRNTDIALKNLRRMQNRKWPKLTKPKVFLASSGRADSEVLDAIKAVFEEPEYNDKYDLRFWEDVNSPGNINQQILQMLEESRYGICYFSEPDPNKSGSFVDNPNVVFEAGMLHGRTGETRSEPTKWIPVREANSGTAPFDFRSERTLVIERDPNGGFDSDAFKKKLASLVNALDESADE